MKSCRNRNKIQFFTWTLGGDHLILRGGGGGGGGWQRPGHIIYFQRELDRKIDFQEYQGQNIYFHPQQFFEKAEKKGEGSECWLRRETGQDFPCVFFIFADYQ